MEKENVIMKVLEMLINSNDSVINNSSAILECNSSLASQYVGEFCIIRTYSAGVHFGRVEQAEGKEVVLSAARRIWSWSDRFTLSKIAEDGLETAKVSCLVDNIYLSESIEILPVSDKSRESIYAIKEHNS